MPTYSSEVHPLDNTKNVSLGQPIIMCPAEKKSSVMDSLQTQQYCRLFVVCPKSLTESQLKQAFEPIGPLHDIYLVRDRANKNASKGVCFVHYLRASDAFTAIEEINGTSIQPGEKPLKVMLAHSKKTISHRGDEDFTTDHLQRLFIVIDSNSTELKLRQYFSTFGLVDNVHIVRDESNSENRGVAYVRYFKASHAARALENCDPGYRAVFAQPRPKVKPSTANSPKLATDDVERNHENTMLAAQTLGLTQSRIQVFYDPSLSAAQVKSLFDIVPGLVDLCFSSDEPGCAYIQYNTPLSAMYAREKINGFEFPTGSRIIVRIAPDTTSINIHSQSSLGMNQNQVSNLTTLLNQTFSKVPNWDAKNIITSPESFNPADFKTFNTQNGGSYTCSIFLPPFLPIVCNPDSSAPTFVLQVICSDGDIREDILLDCFARFGNLVSFAYYSEDNQGIGLATYADKDCANRAMLTLNHQIVNRTKLFILDY